VDESLEQTEKVEISVADQARWWLSRFILIRLRRISLATLPRYGQMDGYQYIYHCLPPVGGRIRSQDIYCLPPAGGRIRSQGNKMRRLRRPEHE
jgi:hypothetical protein